MGNNRIVATSRPEEKRSVGRPRHKWTDNVSSDVLGLGVATDSLRWNSLFVAMSISSWEDVISPWFAIALQNSYLKTIITSKFKNPHK